MPRRRWNRLSIWWHYRRAWFYVLRCKLLGRELDLAEVLRRSPK